MDKITGRKRTYLCVFLFVQFFQKCDHLQYVYPDLNFLLQLYTVTDFQFVFKRLWLMDVSVSLSTCSTV